MRVLLLLLPLGISLLPQSLPAQEINPAVLARLKAATTFIKTPRGQGSGFLFKKSGTTAFVMTCAHVVGDAETVEVVFGSGMPGEKSFEGRVVATDESRDLACLVLPKASGLGTTLEIDVKTDVRETETVFVAGFPFGELLSVSGKNPEISIAKAAVASIRKDDRGQVAVVQLSGDINPGNSGGPAVDAKGKVIGVAQSKILTTQTAFAVPPESLRGFLKGRIKNIAFTPAAATETTARVDVVMELVDPLGTLKAAVMAYIRREEIAQEPQPDQDGNWSRAHASMKEVALRINDATGTATGAFEVRRGAGDPAVVALTFQSRFTQADGTVHWTQPAVTHVEFAEKGAATARKPATPASPNTPSPVPGPAGGREAKDPAPVKGTDLTTADEYTVMATLPLRSVIADLFLSKDGQTLFALDLSEGKIYRIEAATLKVEREVVIADDAVAMALTPNGATIYVVARGPGAGREGVQKGAGVVQVLNAKDLQITSTFPIDVDPVDVDAANSGILAVSCVAQWDGLAVVEASRKGVAGIAHGIYGGSFVRVHPDQSRFYTGDVGLSPGDFHCVPLQPDPKRGYPDYDSPYHGDHPTGADFEISPDGRFLWGSRGVVLRLSRTQKADLQYVGKTEPFLAIGLAEGCNTAILSTPSGFLKEYSADRIELKKSVNVGRICTRLALDPRRGRLYAAAAPVPPAGSSGAESGSFHRRAYLRPADLVAYSLSGKR